MLLVALNTLVAIDQVIPLPLLLVRAAVTAAQASAQSDKEGAQGLLEIANHELQRAVELGYTAEDADYKGLRDEINSLRKQLKGDEDTGSVFTRVKEKLASLTRRQSDRRMRSDQQQQPKKAA